MITLDLSILNQKGTPMFNSDIFANRPAAGVIGRIFISTDTKVFYRDTGTTWELVGGSGTGTISGSGTAGTLPIWTESSVLGDSTLLEGATKFTTTKDFQADGYYLNGMTVGSGALYWASDRVTLANYNVGGSVYIETNGGQFATIIGADLSLTNNGYISAIPSLTAANNASSVAIYGQNSLGIAAGFSSNNIGAIYGAIAGVNLQIFAGSATFAQANVASASLGVNSIDFSSAGSTITMTQAAGIRAMAGNIAQVQYQGTNSGTITHAAIQQNLGFYRPSSASGTLTITNAYSHLINALDDYGAGFTFTNRWGIYQAGASDKNYFAANMLLGSTTDNGLKLQVTGQSYFSSNVGIGATPSARNLTVTSNGIGIRMDNSSNSNAGLEYYVSTGLFYNWLLGAQYNLSNTFEITPSTTLGGTTYSIPAFVVTATGNVGIGGNTPTSKLSVYTSNSGSSPTPIVRLENTGTGYQARMVLTDGTTSDGIIAFQGGVSSTLQYLGFGIGSSPTQMILNGDGNLIIGTTIATGEKLQVNGTAGFSSTVTTGSSFVSIVNNGYGLILKRNAVTNFNGISYQTNNITKWFIGLRENLSSDDYVIYNETTGTDVLKIDSATNQSIFTGSIRVNGQTSATAGGSSGQHLIINCDGTTYKIALLNN
jgi:hypothetical protein